MREQDEPQGDTRMEQEVKHNGGYRSLLARQPFGFGQKLDIDFLLLSNIGRPILTTKCHVNSVTRFLALSHVLTWFSIILGLATLI